MELQESDCKIYRSSFITYEEMFQIVDRYSAALRSLGYSKGDEIPVCMSMIPEFVYFFWQSAGSEQR